MISCNLNFLIQRFYIFLVFFFSAGVTRGEQCDMFVHLVMLLVNVITDAAHFTIVNELLLALKIHRAVVVGATGLLLLLLLLLHLLLLELLLLHGRCRYLLRHETFLKVDAFPHLTISEG